ncbi:PAS domain S-box protein [Myxosarcina sp. GI1]|uniref:PAS domain S-box protein n=1 Tax=Myxosarcina sp. GI1 TaxID=1541065 RepID=UPI00068F9B49|nr:PAS domain S-box protein [Myxosarcina sp. GI1]
MDTDIARVSNSNPSKGMLLQLADGSIQGCNEDAVKILGYSVEQLMGTSSFKPPWQTIHQDGSLFLPETHPGNVSIATGESHSAVVMGLYQPSGKLVWLSIDSQPLYQSGDRLPYAVVVTFSDISEQIAKSEATPTEPIHTPFLFTQEVADAIPGILYLFDAIAQRSLFVNSQVYDRLGYTPEQILAMGANFIEGLMHPEDRDRFVSHIEQLHRSRSSAVYPFEYRLRHKNGEWRWFRSQDRVFSRTSDNSVHQILGIAEEIAQRKQAEAELVKTNNILQSIINDTPDVIYVKDLQGRYVIANQAAADWLNIKISEIVGRDDAALFPPQIARSIIEKDRLVIKSGEFIAYKEQVPYRDTMRSLLTSKYPWRDETGNILGVIGISRDITSLEEAEQKQQEQEQLLKLALSSAKAGFWVWQIAANKVFWSPENYHLYGIDRQCNPLQFQDWERTLYPEDLESTNRQIEKVLAGEKAELRIEFRIFHPQKGIRWLLGIGNVTFDDYGKPIRLSGINLDITERKLVEAKLQNSERHLRRVLDSLTSFVGVMTPDGVLIEANRTALAAAKLQAADVIGKPFAETYWWSYDSEVQAQLNRAIKRAATGAVVRYDVVVRLTSKNYILVDFSIFPLFDPNGRVEYLIPSGIDVSDREASKQALRQSEYELKLITEVIPQQIWTATPNGAVDYINQRWQDYAGATLAQIQERGWVTMVHPDDFSRLNRTWMDSVRSGKKYDMEARLRKADGTYCWFLGRGRPLRNEKGEIIKWYGTNTDITRIKELEEELRQQTEDLLHANQLKDEFLAIVSHELRTPLNPILGWSQLLIDGKLKAQQITTGLNTIYKNATLQLQLINDLLDVSRILRGKLELKLTSVNLSSIIADARETVRLAAEAKSIEILTIFDPNVGRVLGDLARLQQILWNLLTNAIKFTSEGGRITIKLQGDAARAQIQVIDTGIGIESDFLPYVFERFRQAESSNTRNFGGLGLGLAIVRHLSELHGGTVKAESLGKGKGATFTVTLPISGSCLEIEPAETVKLTPTNLTGTKFLVVDDDADSRDMLLFILKAENAEVKAVASGSEAIEIFKEFKPHFLISDISMPEMNGYQLLQKIQSLSVELEIEVIAISLSAHATERDRQQSMEAGFARHINKPIDINAFIDLMVQLISKD